MRIQATKLFGYSTRWLEDPDVSSVINVLSLPEALNFGLLYIYTYIQYLYTYHEYVYIYIYISPISGKLLGMVCFWLYHYKLQHLEISESANSTAVRGEAVE